MFPSVSLLALGGALLVADGLPALNVEPGCRAAAKMGDSLSLDTSLQQCLADLAAERHWMHIGLLESGQVAPQRSYAVRLRLKGVQCYV